MSTEPRPIIRLLAPPPAAPIPEGSCPARDFATAAIALSIKGLANGVKAAGGFHRSEAIDHANVALRWAVASMVYVEPGFLGAADEAATAAVCLRFVAAHLGDE